MFAKYFEYYTVILKGRFFRGHAVVFIFTARRNARIASAVLATAIPSVHPSVRLSVRTSVRHTLVLCQNDGT